MPRSTNNAASKNRHKKILKLAKGYRLGKSKLYRTAKDQVEKGLQYAYRDRKQKKRHFRRLWITRINAACRIHGLSYSKFMHLLSVKEIDLNRKVLADIAMNQPEAFEAIVNEVKN